VRALSFVDVLALVLTGATKAGEGALSNVTVDQDVRRFANAWVAAEARGDVASLEIMLADDFVGVGPLGFMLSKHEWLARHQQGDLRYESIDLTEVTLRRYRNAAILTARQEQVGTYRGTSISAALRAMLVFVQVYRRWQLAGLHFSPIGQPPSPERP
jgi:hypothetical protein